MAWNHIKKLLGISKNATISATPRPDDEGHVALPPDFQAAYKNPAFPEIPLISADQSPWQVPVLDLRPFMQVTISASSNEECARNLVSFGGDDGQSFIGQEPMEAQSHPAHLVYKIDQKLANGVLFSPQCMEHKWAIFHYDHKIICVRSWLRRVALVAHLEEHADSVTISRIDGSFGAGTDEADLAARLLDFLLRSHVLASPWPCPLLPDLAQNSGHAAQWCFSLFGNRVEFATQHTLPYYVPSEPIRVNSLLHIAVAKGNIEDIEKQLVSTPIDLLANDGLTTLQWALASENKSVLSFLLDNGCPVDIRSVEGATALMNAAQSNATDHTQTLLERGADSNARDNRGFTALHRAAETGFIEIVKLLLKHNANANVEAAGYTPKALAELRNNVEIVAILTAC